MDSNYELLKKIKAYTTVNRILEGNLKMPIFSIKPEYLYKLFEEKPLQIINGHIVIRQAQPV